MKTSKILYVASTASHLKRFHRPYLEAIRENAHVTTLASGDGVDISLPFDKRYFSFSNLRTVKRIRCLIRSEKFDLILLHTTLAAFLVRLALVGMKNRPYVKNVVHGYLFPERRGGIRGKILYFCERILCRYTDEIAVMNEEDLRIATSHKLCRGKVSFFWGMGLSDDFAKAKTDAVLRQEYASEGELLCSFVGELSARKNQRLLLDAAARLRAEGIPVKLLLVGEGSAREELENQCRSLGLSDAVFLVGNREPVLPYLAITDLYVCASRSEGLPFNLLEAMRCGLPIVASDVKGQNDLLNADSLYPVDDLDALCRRIRDVYEGGSFGAGARVYPNLDRYLLSSVFEENLDLFLKKHS